MTIDSPLNHESTSNPDMPPVVTEAFIPEKHAPLLTKFIEENIIKHLPSYLQELANRSILTWRRYDDDKSIILPTTESFREQILALISDEKTGAVDPKSERYRQFFERLSKGFVYCSDGVKVQSVSSAKEELGNAYIIGNAEILLMAAAKLECEIIPGVYSGDESVTFFLPKVNSTSKIELNEANIKQAILNAQNEYYRDNPETSPFFKQVQGSMSYNLKDDLKNKDAILGLDGKIASVASIFVKKQVRVDKEKNITQQNFRERSLMAAIIDAVEHKFDNEQSDTIQTLITAIESTIAKPRTINKDPRYINHGKTMKRWPQEVKAMYGRAIRELNKSYNATTKKEIKELKNNPEYDLKLRQIHAFAELAVYESLYAGDLEVRKIQWLQGDIEHAVKRGNKVRLLRFADASLKLTNKDSHLKGDNNLKATSRIIENAIKKTLTSHGKSEKEVEYILSNIKIYQHYGSFILSSEFNSGSNSDEINNILDEALQDSISLNVDSISNDVNYDRFALPEHHSRAVPLIATTTHVYNSEDPGHPKQVVITSENLTELWQNINDLRIQQEINETGVAFTMGIHANSIIEYIDESATKLTESSAVALEFLLSFLNTFYSNYIALRPNRVRNLNIYSTQSRENLPKFLSRHLGI